MKERDTLIYNTTVAEVMNLKIDNYHTSFLTQMVLRRIKHPEEKMDRIASKTMKMMPKIYKRKDKMITSFLKIFSINPYLSLPTRHKNTYILMPEAANVISFR